MNISTTFLEHKCYFLLAGVESFRLGFQISFHLVTFVLMHVCFYLKMIIIVEFWTNKTIEKTCIYDWKHAERVTTNPDLHLHIAYLNANRCFKPNKAYISLLPLEGDIHSLLCCWLYYEDASELTENATFAQILHHVSLDWSQTCSITITAICKHRTVEIRSDPVRSGRSCLHKGVFSDEPLANLPTLLRRRIAT